MIDYIKRCFNKFKDYDYIDVDDFSKYHIKYPKEFISEHGGICWDFVVSMAQYLTEHNVKYKCYFTEVQKDNKEDETVATHTYIIADKKYWIECSWQKYKGINVIQSFKDIEELLLKYYKCDNSYTVEYNPLNTCGLTEHEFFNYLNKYGKEV